MSWPIALAILVRAILKHQAEILRIRVSYRVKILKHRERCAEIELLREQSGLLPSRQSTQPVRARHALKRLVRR